MSSRGFTERTASPPRSAAACQSSSGSVPPHAAPLRSQPHALTSVLQANRTPGRPRRMTESRARTPAARSRAFLSAFSRLGYDPMLGKIDRSRRWKSHRNSWGLTGAKASIGGTP